MHNNYFCVLIAALINNDVKPQLSSINYPCHLYFADTEDQIVKVSPDIDFDLIILDQVFACNEAILTPVKNKHPKAPLIVLSGEDIALDEWKRLIQVGCDDYLVKPLTADNLSKTLAFWLGLYDFVSIKHSIDTLLVKTNRNQRLVATLWQQLFNELPLQIEEILEVMKTQDYLTTYECIHKLNGSAKVCCLHEIELLASDMEVMLLNKQYTNIGDAWMMLQKKISSLLMQRQQIFDYITTL